MSFPLLTVTAVVPAAGAVVTAAVPAARKTAAKYTALLFSLATLVLAAVALVRFDPDGDRYQLTESHAWIKDFGLRYELGVDGIAVTLIALTALLIPFVMLAGWHDADSLETPAGSGSALIAKRAESANARAGKMIAIPAQRARVCRTFIDRSDLRIPSLAF